MSSQGSSDFGSSDVAPQAGAQPPRRRSSAMTTVVAVLVVAALAVGGFAIYRSQNHTARTADSATNTSVWNSTSGNWSGYAETTAQTGQKFTSATLSWVVDAVAPLASSQNGCQAQWVGIGGATSKDLIQLGTQGCSYGGQISYGAWIETLPAAETPIPSLSIQPGDTVVATLGLVSGPQGGSTQAATANYQALMHLILHFDPSFPTTHVIQRLRQLESHFSTEPWFPAVEVELHKLFSSPAPTSSTSQVWRFNFKVTAPNGSVQTFSKTVDYQSSLSSVEWITEAPTDSAGVQPLPNYGVARYFGDTVNGTVPTWSPTNQIILEDSHGQVSVPSAPASQDAFNTCFFPNINVATQCAIP